MLLKHEPQTFRAFLGQDLLRQRIDARVPPIDRPRARPVQTAQQVQQRALPRPRRPQNCDDAGRFDDEIDAAFSAIMRQLISYMMEDARTITPALEIIFIAKSIDRIGDHAKNIAEAVVQVVKGKDVRHASAEQIRAEIAGP